MLDQSQQQVHPPPPLELNINDGAGFILQDDEFDDDDLDDDFDNDTTQFSIDGSLSSTSSSSSKRQHPRRSRTRSNRKRGGHNRRWRYIAASELSRRKTTLIAITLFLTASVLLLACGIMKYFGYIGEVDDPSKTKSGTALIVIGALLLFSALYQITVLVIAVNKGQPHPSDGAFDESFD
ncbi:hypothetical protein SAMD00019534_001000 [Acytostelium subglobosum LB1]|uniref:hypothetical protein n=1 Tax=Acytostelium subglobosum LB1 TaxID=1410327 RepID=UPI0006449265|nr:hypothetical protein SAMD00019534_001000 [Acytostelium subglobosum LB1]GAM16925.1 hypothetical protein SAMD00019534_001000 [Acytostelium subglobosum LB1]|eukprot:XP_012758987.1 hypothetical protein SAMD00019534_001000 [Acytostelium subglobosum LB1]